MFVFDSAVSYIFPSISKLWCFCTLHLSINHSVYTIRVYYFYTVSVAVVEGVKWHEAKSSAIYITPRRSTSSNNNTNSHRQTVIENIEKPRADLGQGKWDQVIRIRQTLEVEMNKMLHRHNTSRTVHFHDF